MKTINAYGLVELLAGLGSVDLAFLLDLLTLTGECTPHAAGELRGIGCDMSVSMRQHRGGRGLTFHLLLRDLRASSRLVHVVPTTADEPGTDNVP